MSDTLAPRELARRDAARGAIQLMRLLMLIALVECGAVVIDLATAPVPPLLAQLGNSVRVLLALATFLGARRLQGWAGLLGFGMWMATARGLALVSLGFGVVRVLGLQAPAGVPDQVWPALIATLANIGLVGALALALYTVSRFALLAELVGAGRSLALASVPLVSALVAGLGVVDAALLPVWWLGAALALATPWVLALAGVLEWARALLPTVFIGTTLVLLTLFGVAPPIIAGLAAIAALVTAATFPRGPLAALHMLLGEEATAAPSRTFIRRLLDGPPDALGADGSRLGSQAEASSAEESLALAYRELGIEAPAAKGTAPLEPIGAIAKLEPIHRAPRPALALVRTERVPPPMVLDATERDMWQSVSRGVRALFLGFIARSTTLIVAFLLSHGPAGREPLAATVALLVLGTGGVLCTMGLWRMAAMPRRARARSSARVALVFALAMIGVDLALAVAVGAAPEHVPLLAAIGAATWLVMIGAAIASLSQLFHDLDPSLVKTRATAPALLLGTYVTFAAIATLAATSADSELNWLAIPSGIATGLIGLAFFVSMLWLLNDTREALRDWQTRLDRAISPTQTDA